MENVTPLFFSHASKKSILTGWTEKEWKDNGGEKGPPTIVKLAKDNGIKRVSYVCDSFHDYFEIQKNLKSEKIGLNFGLEMIFCNDAKDQSPQSLSSNHKVIIWQKNSKGYKDLIRIFSACNADITNKYYTQRFDFKQLNNLWTENLFITLPFFSSFIARNSLVYGASIVPDFPIKPKIHRELDTAHPFESIINDALDKFNIYKDYEEINTKTIYYENRSDFPAYTTYMAIQEKSTFNKPQMEYFCSNNFCLESYKELSKGKD